MNDTDLDKTLKAYLSESVRKVITTLYKWLSYRKVVYPFDSVSLQSTN